MIAKGGWSITFSKDLKTSLPRFVFQYDVKIIDLSRDGLGSISLGGKRSNKGLPTGRVRSGEPEASSAPSWVESFPKQCLSCNAVPYLSYIEGKSISGRLREIENRIKGSRLHFSATRER
jgi:hypothetical protein